MRLLLNKKVKKSIIISGDTMYECFDDSTNSSKQVQIQ